MKAVPRTHHLLAATILLGVAVVYGYQAALDDRISEQQINIATVAVKEHRPELFPHDPVYGRRGVWRVYTPVFQSLLKLVLVPNDYQSPDLPFRLMVPVVALVFMGSMYALLYRECRSWSVATFVAVVSTRVTYTLGRTYWGVGSLASMTPATLFLAGVPLVIMAMLRHDDIGRSGRKARPSRLFFLFGLIGLGGNLNLVMAMNLTLVMLMVYLARRRFALSAWPTAMGCALSALIGAMPYTLYYLALRWRITPFTAAVETMAVENAFQIARLDVLFPQILEPMLLGLVPMALFVAVPATVLRRTERFKTPHLGFWIWFGAAGLFVATACQGASQAVGKLMGTGPPVVDFMDASKYVMLPIYVLVAQGLTSIFRLMRTHRHMVRWICALLAALWMLTSDNLRVTRHAAEDAATLFIAEADKPRSVRRHHRHRRERKELIAIAQWARRHTGAGAVFVVGDPEFRLLARRSIVASRFDARAIFYLTPWHLGELMNRADQQDRLLNPKQSDRLPEEQLQFFKELATQDEFRQADGWFLIVPQEVIVENIEMLEEIASPPGPGGWGQSYRVYRIKLPARPKPAAVTRPD